MRGTIICSYRMSSYGAALIWTKVWTIKQQASFKHLSSEATNFGSCIALIGMEWGSVLDQVLSLTLPVMNWKVNRHNLNFPNSLRKIRDLRKLSNSSCPGRNHTRSRPTKDCHLLSNSSPPTYAVTTSYSWTTPHWIGAERLNQQMRTRSP